MAINIQNKNNSTVVIIDKPKTITFYENDTSILGSSKITIPKPTKTTKIPTPTPRVEPPTQTQSQPQAQTQTQTLNASGNLIDQINEYRISKGLSKVSTDQYTCAFANTRAGEIASTFNHDGFSGRINSKNLPYPTYSEIAENIAMNSDKNAVIQGWIDSPGHNENMLKNTPFACIGNSGNYYVYEAWRP